jgi:hypothetical protein
VRVLSENCDGSIEILNPEPFDLEIRLQELLEQHPDLVLADLPSDQDRSIWTIGWEVATEAGSIDLLMLDSTAQVWVVETKLASNSEVKKQVVGQVPGYASAVAGWDADRLNAVGTQYVNQRAATGHSSLLEFLSDDLGDEASAQSLIDDAAAKLAQGDLIALIVVDDAPKELRRLVEFVNSHATFELLALKLEVLPHHDRRLFIPTVIGAIARSDDQRPRSRRKWDRESILTELGKADAVAAEIAGNLIDWAIEEPLLEPYFGTGVSAGSFIAVAQLAGDDWIPTFAVYTSGHISPTWRYRKSHNGAPFWLPMVEAFTEIGGEAQKLERSRQFPINALTDTAKLARFKEVVLSTVRAASELSRQNDA